MKSLFLLTALVLTPASAFAEGREYIFFTNLDRVISSPKGARVCTDIVHDQNLVDKMEWRFNLYEGRDFVNEQTVSEIFGGGECDIIAIEKSRGDEFRNLPFSKLIGVYEVKVD